MGKIDTALDASRVLAAAGTFRQWCRNSMTGRLLANERVLQALLGVILLGSLGSVLGSNMATTTKFLSFALLFVVTAGLSLWLLHQAAE